MSEHCEGCNVPRICPGVTREDIDALVKRERIGVWKEAEALAAIAIHTATTSNLIAMFRARAAQEEDHA